ncbi:MAG: hypothetical protein K2Y22_06195 [Candidatus Obscuribacterales bacterium]|nr:hypothetical protein [Candidatus Obscuribacterales bacterium]
MNKFDQYVSILGKARPPAPVNFACLATELDFTLGHQLTDEDLAALLPDCPNLRSLKLRATDITDAGLAHLSGLRNLEMLDLGQMSNITNDGMRHLSGLTQLRSLNIDYSTTVGDAGLAHLQGLTNLEVLWTDGRNITDAGMPYFAKLKKLQGVNLHSSAVSDAGLVHLSGLTDLKTLTLTGTAITDRGLASLSSLTKLEKLYLYNVENTITDAWLSHIAGFTRLQELDVSHCDSHKSEITDAGLAYLSGLSNLAVLRICGAKITDAGLAHISHLAYLTDADVRLCRNISSDACRLWQELLDSRKASGAIAARIAALGKS